MVVPPEHLASSDALERTLEPQRRAAQGRPQGQRAWLLPQVRLARRGVPLDALRVLREPEQQWLAPELFWRRQEPAQDGLPVDGLRADERQAHGRPEDELQERVHLGRPLRVYQVWQEPRPEDAGRAAVAQPWQLLLSRRVPHRQLLRRPLHPSNGGGLFRQLRR